MSGADDVAYDIPELLGDTYRIYHPLRTHGSGKIADAAGNKNAG
jgi:hypothetical protein